MKLSASATATGALLALCASSSMAQTTKAPPVRPIGAVTATSSDSITMLGGVRHLPNGNLLVNDLIRRRVVLLDQSLNLVSVIADTMPGSPNPYGPRPGALISYKGDSTLFIDASSLSMLVIDGNGQIARVMSVPRSQDAGMLSSTVLGGMGFDGERMVYRGSTAFTMRSSGPANPGSASSGPTFNAPTMPDTMPIVRVNIATRTLDTVAFIKVSQPKTNITRSEDGNMSVSIELNPLPVVDEYAVLSDGRLAIVRGRDYHVEFIDGAGKATVGPKIPFEWKRLTDEDKVAFIDSVKAATDRATAAGGSAAGRVGAAMGAAMGAGGPPQVITSTQVQTRAGGSASGEPIRRGDGGSFTMRMAAPNVSYIDPGSLPDYQPAFFGNQVRGDMDGNVWVRIIPPKPIAGGPVYDVINGKGELIDRVQVPVGREISGFGAGGVIYLSSRENGNLKLERASFR